MVLPHSLRWHEDAIIYGVDVGLFMDGDGDGRGDFEGLLAQLPYITELGVTCIWLLPFYPSPNCDNGYDISDYFGVEPTSGTPGELVEFIQEANARGIHVLIDLVLNHTSDKHPWFQQARKNPCSRYRDFYIWSDKPIPPPPGKGPMFPGQEESVWTFDEEAGAYFYHRFYRFQPELNLANPALREEIRRILTYWLQLGVSGFRVDAASHMVEGAPGQQETSIDILKEVRGLVSQIKGSTVLLGEVDEDADIVARYFGEGDELNAQFNFILCNYLFLALARKDCEPLVQGLELLPRRPGGCQWFNFLRNLDEADLERITAEQRQDIFDAFAPEKEMQIFGRGVRRRLAPMLGGNLARMKLAYGLLFSMPGSPLIVFGDEIGMGDDLSRKGRESVRTPMQWTDDPNAGFSTADPAALLAPLVTDGKFAFDKVNVAGQDLDPDSLLNWIRWLARIRMRHPEIGRGELELLETGDRAVFAHKLSWQGLSFIAVHNLDSRPKRAELDLRGYAVELSSSAGDVGPVRRKTIDLEPYGCRWHARTTATAEADPDRGRSAAE